MPLADPEKLYCEYRNWVSHTGQAEVTSSSTNGARRKTHSGKPVNHLKSMGYFFKTNEKNSNCAVFVNGVSWRLKDVLSDAKYRRFSEIFSSIFLPGFHRCCRQRWRQGRIMRFRQCSVLLRGLFERHRFPFPVSRSRTYSSSLVCPSAECISK